MLDYECFIVTKRTYAVRSHWITSITRRCAIAYLAAVIGWDNATDSRRCDKILYIQLFAWRSTSLHRVPWKHRARVHAFPISTRLSSSEIYYSWAIEKHCYSHKLRFSGAFLAFQNATSVNQRWENAQVSFYNQDRAFSVASSTENLMWILVRETKRSTDSEWREDTLTRE